MNLANFLYLSGGAANRKAAEGAAAQVLAHLIALRFAAADAVEQDRAVGYHGDGEPLDLEQSKGYIAGLDAAIVALGGKAGPRPS